MPTRKIRIQAKWIIATFALSALIILPALLKFAFSIKISSDWLSYYGTCLATVGTVFLGAVALWQNQELNRKDKEAKEYLEQQKKEAIKPKIECENIITKNLNLIVSLSNNQKNEACNICVENASELSFPKKVIIAPLRLKQIIPSLKASQSTQLVFDNEFYLFDYYLIFTICYDDTEKHTYRLYIEASHLSANPNSEWKIEKMEYLD